MPQAESVTQQENLPDNFPAPSPKRKRGTVRRAAALCGWGGSVTAAGYLLQGPVAAGVVLAGATVVVCTVAVLRPVLLDGSDPRSPFVRFMLLVCVLIGRPPADYLPPNPPER